MIWIVKTTGGREEIVAELLEAEAEKIGANVYSILIAPGIKGYIFVEADKFDTVVELIRDIKHAKKVLPKPIEVKDIEKFIKVKPLVEKVNIGDIVEVIAGPLKGSRGRVTAFDEETGEVTIELLDSVVPIPVSVNITDIKLVQRAEKEEKKEEAVEEFLFLE